MKLTFDQIKAITFGAIRFEETENGLLFHKFTQKQLDAYLALSETLYQRALSTTGIRLDFHTNSKTFTFKAKGKYDLYVNGLLREHYKTPTVEEYTVALTDPIGDPIDEARVTLYFPSHSAGVLCSVELDDGATVTPHRFDRKMLMIGDSITQGWDCHYDSLSYAIRVTDFFNAESVIQGVGGGYFHETLYDDISFEPDIVTVALGTNDFGKFHTLDELRAHAGAHLELLGKRYADKQLFFISPIWRECKEKPMGTFSECRAVVIEEALRNGFIHIDGLRLCPPVPELYADGTLHPNDLGFSVYAQRLTEELRAYIR